MSEPLSPTNPEFVSSIDEANKILPLEEIRINFQTASGERHTDWSLFHKRQNVGVRQFWWLLGNEFGPFSKTRLIQIREFLKKSDIQKGIKSAHDLVTTGVEKSMSRTMFTSLMLYPLFQHFLKRPPEQFGEVFSQWENNWSSGVDPEKFHSVFSPFFRLLSRSSKETQEDFLAVLGDKPVQESEVDFLAGIFEKVYGEINDVDKITAADRRNRALTEDTTKKGIALSSEDLYHTTDLSTLPSIISKGLLATECTSLTQDGFREATFGVSMHTFKSPPKSLAELGDELTSGQDTIIQILDKVHLAFLNPQSLTEPEFMLYPPDSFWFDRAERKNLVAGRYIAGYDSRAGDFQNKTIAYTLIGLPSPGISFVMLDEKLAEPYAKLAKTFPFYLPAYSYKGQLLYTAEQYDRDRKIV